jgi:hypothetical protein
MIGFRKTNYASGREGVGIGGSTACGAARPFLFGAFSPRCRLVSFVVRRGLGRGRPPRTSLKLVGASASAFFGDRKASAAQVFDSGSGSGQPLERSPHSGRNGDGDAFHGATLVAPARADRCVVSRRLVGVMSYEAGILTPEVRHG